MTYITEHVRDQNRESTSIVYWHTFAIIISRFLDSFEKLVRPFSTFVTTKKFYGISNSLTRKQVCVRVSVNLKLYNSIQLTFIFVSTD